MCFKNFLEGWSLVEEKSQLMPWDGRDQSEGDRREGPRRQGFRIEDARSCLCIPSVFTDMFTQRCTVGHVYGWTCMVETMTLSVNVPLKTFAIKRLASFPYKTMRHVASRLCRTE